MKAYTKHHVIPRSRGGRQGHTVEIPDTFHVAWHKVFGNLYGEEVVEFVRELNQLMEKEDRIASATIEKLRTKKRRNER